jgi:hypothetical protein
MSEAEIEEARVKERHRVAVPRWLVGVVILWICLITGVTAWGFLRLERNTDAIAGENLERREAACEAANETRGVIRDMAKNSALEAGEALIEVASEASEQTVAAFRSAIDRRITVIVNQLPGREWDPRATECVDVPLEKEE